MTINIGIQTEHGAWIGSDSLVSTNGFKAISTVPKVFHNGNLLFGTCGSTRMTQLLRYQLTNSLKPDNDIEPLSDMVTLVIPTVRKLFEENWKDHKDSEGEYEGGTFLVAYQGELFVVYSDYQVQQYASGLYAIGSGQEYAYGALLAQSKQYTPDQRIENVLDIVSQLDPHVAPPFTIEYQPKPVKES